MSEAVCRVTRQMLAGNGTFITRRGQNIAGEAREKHCQWSLAPVSSSHVTSGGMSPGMMGSCVRIDLNHLSMHEHSRRQARGESFEEK